MNPAQRLARHMFAFNVALAAAGITVVVLLMAQLFERWQIRAGRAHGTIAILGQPLSYPAANAGAIVVAVFAGLGFVVLTAALRAIVRELRADRRFARALARRRPVSFRGAWLLDGDCPQAFCAGLLRPRVYLTRAAVELLSTLELSAVLAHESHHAQCRDPLRLAVGRVLADALFFFPPLRRLIGQQQSLAEIGADEAAVRGAGGGRAALASAMLTFSEASGDVAGGIAAERIDYLVGEGPAWRFPLVLCSCLALCLAALVAFAVLAAESASGSVTLALPFVSSQPCVLMLALVPGGVGLVAARCLRRGPRPRRLALPAHASQN